MIKELLNYWVLQSLAMLLTAFLIPRLTITSLFGALAIVASLALVNATIWDAALFFSIPDAFSAQAALLLAANGVIFWILVKLLPGIEVEGVLPAVLAPVLFAVISLLISIYLRDFDWIEFGKYLMNIVEQLRDFFFAKKDAFPLTGTVEK